MVGTLGWGRGGLLRVGVGSEAREAVLCLLSFPSLMAAMWDRLRASPG